MPERHRSLIALVDLMADGRWHSGQALGDHIGISRAAVWKHLSHLKELGLPLESVTGRGYRVVNPSLALNAQRIQAHLQPRTRALTTLHVFPILASSNDWLLQRAWPPTGALDVCAVDCQTAGRGRRGRQWQTPFGASVALSVSRRFDSGVAALGPLSVVVALIVQGTLARLGFRGLGVKWPNDIVVGRDKLCGILIEMSGEISGPVKAVIGIGLNVALPERLRNQMPWTDLRTLGGGHGNGGEAPDGNPLDRNQLVGELLNSLDVGLARFESHGFEPFEDQWQRADVLRDQEIDVHQGKNVYAAVAKGLTAEGCLRVMTEQGEQQVSAGDVSVRRT